MKMRDYGLQVLAAVYTFNVSVCYACIGNQLSSTLSKMNVKVKLILNFVINNKNRFCDAYDA